MALKNSNITIRVATESDIDNAIKILKSHFINDSILVWIIEDFEARDKAFDDFFYMYVAAGVNSGFVDLAETPEMGIVGVMVWLPHDVDTESENDVLVKKYTKNFTTYADIMHEYYPPVAPFFQLATTAVLQSVRGMGIGGALISHGLNRFDKINMPTYLEATSRRVAGGIYTRYGYQPSGNAISFPNGAEAYPMWRPPQEAGMVTPPPKLHITKNSTLVGGLIRFGNHKWRVLDVKDGKALILSEQVIEAGQYHENCEPVTWESSGLRKYLNTEFYSLFSKEEQSKIVSMPINNSENPWFKTGQGKETTDNIFLPSAEDAVKYFGDTKQLQKGNANSKYFISDHFNEARKAFDPNGYAACWWLRTSGNLPYQAAFVTADGRISMIGDFVNRNNNTGAGVRPALWIELEDKKENVS
ncbi:MAG: DUF6273 domain-containing protein [Defluviitaleaceae bacterium]|nr:DUF6273 domain-containing protein [Defluviitaleaceae bacterium]MCL2262256.1 DUF6273 domain-containing protein [Defluviitaleaceae bacterium]